MYRQLIKNLQGITENSDGEFFKENSNKDGKLAPILRDMIAGEASRFFLAHVLGDFPKRIQQAIANNVIKFHDADYFLQRIHNCCILNLSDMLDNGTVLNKRGIDPPSNFLSACNISTQIVAATFSAQYGGTSMSLLPLAKYLRKSEEKYRLEFGEERIVRKLMQRELTDGIQTINYQLNTLSACNGQTPFTTVFMYINEDPEYEKEVVAMTDEMLNQRYRGIKDESGHYATFAFPKLIYVLDENNIHPSSKYYWLTEKAAKCTAKRMNPDFISAKIMRENYAGNVFPPMGCRSFLNPWRNGRGEYQFNGRCNMGVVTLNLPQIAIEAAGDVARFWALFAERMELVREALLIKFERFTSATSDVSPIHFQYGAMARLPPGTSVRGLVSGKYATLAVGYIGVYEAVKHMTGESSTSAVGRPFGLEIIRRMRETCDRWNAACDLQFSLYGTPSESTAGQMCQKDLERYGKIADITDKGWYTNSFHVDVRERINAFDKLAYEAEFQKYSSGGCISYVEIPNIKDNYQAMMQIIRYMYDTILYAEFNTKCSDYCRTCQFEGEILLDDAFRWRCPACGEQSERNLNVVRRTCGYIGENFWNEGKTREIRDRQEHVCVPAGRGIVDMDYANGDGLRTSVWFTGCPHGCHGCHNQHLWRFDPAFELDVSKVVELTRATRRISLLGGEPLAPYNRQRALDVVRRVRAEVPDCSVYVWTGYERDALRAEADPAVVELMRTADKVVFGPFVEELRVNNPLYGSSNQYVVGRDELLECFAAE